MDYIGEVSCADIRKWGGNTFRPTAPRRDTFVLESGLKVVSRQISENHGLLDLKRGAIVLNSQMAEQHEAWAVSNWTVAHELGQFRLHRACFGQRQLGPRGQPLRDQSTDAAPLPSISHSGPASL